MNVDGKHFRTIWLKPNDSATVQIIDQRHLPHDFVVEDLMSVDQMATAIKDMHVRGAGLIGAAAGYGTQIAALTAPEGRVGWLYAGRDCGWRARSSRPHAPPRSI